MVKVKLYKVRLSFEVAAENKVHASSVVGAMLGQSIENCIGVDVSDPREVEIGEKKEGEDKTPSQE